MLLNSLKGHLYIYLNKWCIYRRNSLCDRLFCSDRKWRPMEAPAGSVFFLAMGVGPPSDVWSGFRFFFSRRKWALWAQTAEPHLLWKSLQEVMKVELGLYASLQHTCAVSWEQLQTFISPEETRKVFYVFTAKLKLLFSATRTNRPRLKVFMVNMLNNISLMCDCAPLVIPVRSKCTLFGWLALNLCYRFVRLANVARPSYG